MRKIAPILAALFLCTALYASVIATDPYSYRGNWGTLPNRYVQTNVSITYGFTASTTSHVFTGTPNNLENGAVVCPGSVQITPSLNFRWAAPSFVGQLSYPIWKDPSCPSCPDPPAPPIGYTHNNLPMLDPTLYTDIINHGQDRILPSHTSLWPRVAEDASTYEQVTYYGRITEPIQVQDGNSYQSFVCSASMAMTQNSNPVHSEQLTSPTPAPFSITLPSTGAHTLAEHVDTNCIAVARILPEQQKYVLGRINSNNAHRVTPDLPLQLQVVNPSLSITETISPTSAEMAPGSSLPVTIHVSNSASSYPLSVWATGATASSAFTFSTGAGFNQDIASGASADLQGNLIAPSPFTVPQDVVITVAFATPEPGCSGVLTANVPVTIRITPPSGQNSCTVTNPSGSCLNPGGSRLFTTHCYNGATETTCPLLYWSTTIDGNSYMLPVTTPNITAPQSTLHVSNSATVPQNGFVNASEIGGGMRCTGADACIQAGMATTCTLADVSGGNPLHPGDSHNFNATCYDGNNSQTSCPQFFWSTSSLTQVAIIPSTPSVPGMAPQRILAISPYASTQQDGSINVTNGAGLSCGATVQVRPPHPPNIPCAIHGSATLLPGQSATYQAECYDFEGELIDCPTGLHWTTTLVNANMNPQYTPTVPFPPNFQSSVLTTALTPAPQSGQVRARNETYDPDYVCTPATVQINSAPTLQPDLIANLSTNATSMNLFYGESALIGIITRNIGTLDSQNTSVTRLYKNGAPDNCPIAPIGNLEPNTQANRACPYHCNETEPPLAVFNATADVTSKVYESNESNNNAAPGLRFTCSPVPVYADSCILEPNPAQIPYKGTQRFNITCFDNSTGMPATAPCPLTLINWSTDCGGFDPVPSNCNCTIVRRNNLICTNVEFSHVGAPGFSCRAIIGDLPDIVTGIDVTDLTPNSGDTIYFDVWASNIGVLPAGASELNVTVDGTHITNSPFDVPILPLNGVYRMGQNHDYKCSLPGLITIRSYGDAMGNVTESNENNNNAFVVVNCGGVLACPDYV